MRRNTVLCLSLAVLVNYALAETDSGKELELRRVQAEIEDVESDVRELQTSKNTQIDQLRKLEKQYGEIANSLSSIRAQIKLQELDLQDVRERISDTQQDIQHQKSGLEGLIRSAYVLGDKDGLKVMMNQRDSAQSSRMLVYYDYLTKARLKKMQAIEHSVEELRLLEAQKDTDAQLLQAALEKKQQESDALKALKDQRQKLLAQIEQDFDAKNGQLDRLMHSEKRLQSLVESLQKDTNNNATAALAKAQTDQTEEKQVEKQPSGRAEKVAEESSKPLPTRPFAELQGQLPWPVAGAISERFGSQRFETQWDGVVISAREGADVRAVGAGRIAYADWLRGYGLMLIVDHGKGYMSLYAFNQSLRKEVGDYVKAGESVASVGRSGGRSQAALYFGIRKHGRAIDPEKWCRKLAKG